MALSLYDLSIPSYLQTLTAVGGFLEKGAAFCESAGKDSAELVSARLIADMQPLRFQIISVAQHSRGAVEGAMKGLFGPPSDPGTADYKTLQALIAETRETLQKVTPEAVNALQGKDMIFQLGKNQLPFVVEDFILSFSLPNFYFHATTAYDILRSLGVPLGKRDFLGKLRLKA